MYSLLKKKSKNPDIVTNEKGFTSDGRIVGNYGTPRIDGEIDDVRNKAIEIQSPHTNNAEVKNCIGILSLLV